MKDILSILLTIIVLGCFQQDLADINFEAKSLNLGKHIERKITKDIATLTVSTSKGNYTFTKPLPKNIFDKLQYTFINEKLYNLPQNYNPDFYDDYCIGLSISFLYNKKEYIFHVCDRNYQEVYKGQDIQNPICF